MVAIIILASLSAIFHDDYHPLDFCNLLLLRFSRNRKNTKNNPGQPFPKCGRDRSSGNSGEYQDFAYRGGIQDTCPAVRGNVF